VLPHPSVQVTPQSRSRRCRFLRPGSLLPRETRRRSRNTLRVEGTGSYGAGLARFLAAAGCTGIEVNRALRVALRSAVKMRTQTYQQMRALIVTAPADLREQLRTLSRQRLVDAAVCLRLGRVTTAVAAMKRALRCLAQRHQQLAAEVVTLDRDLDRLVAAAAPTLCALKGVGTDVAGAVLVAAGDHPERLRSEGAFANLFGVAPLPASSGKTSGRHRLNRGGDRHANCALWCVVIVRLATDAPTKNYMARRTQEGMSKPDIIRCLKRYVAREIYRELQPRAALAAAA
jgi:transposase